VPHGHRNYRSRSGETPLDENKPIPEAVRPTMFCTLEDVIEELLHEEIYDEEDIERRQSQSGHPALHIKSDRSSQPYSPPPIVFSSNKLPLLEGA